MSRRTASRPPARSRSQDRASEEKIPAMLVEVLDAVPFPATWRNVVSHAIQVMLRPHTVSALLVGVFMLLQLTSVEPTTPDHIGYRRNILRGCLSAFLVMIMFMVLHGPNTSAMTRPHPAVWRLILGVSLCYVVFLAFILFQNLDTVRDMFSFLDPALVAHRSQPERQYTDQGCAIYTPNHPDGMFANVIAVWKDEFVIAHVLGYVCKAIMLRDWRLVTLSSVVFELIEVALQHRLPNFRECWWDHIIIDVLMCNAFGTLVGICIVNYFNGRPLEWVGGVKPKRADTLHYRVSERLKNLVLPLDFVVYEWRMFSSLKRFVYVWFIVIGLNMVDTHAFYIKTLIGVPPPHPYNMYRLLIWWTMACCAVREYYHFVEHEDVRKLGAQAWVTGAAILFESLVIHRLSAEMPELQKPWPFYIGYPMIAWAVLVTVFLVLFFSSAQGRWRQGMWVAYVASHVPLVAMFVMGNADLKV